MLALLALLSLLLFPRLALLALLLRLPLLRAHRLCELVILLLLRAGFLCGLVRLGRTLLQLPLGLACVLGTRLRALLLQLFGQRLDFGLEILRALRHFLRRHLALLGRAFFRRRALVGLLVGRTGLAALLVREPLLRVGQIARFITQRFHGAFHRRALQHFRALVQLLAHLLLLRG